MDSPLLLTHLKTVGYLMFALSALHLVFPKRFRWKEDLAQLQALNRQIFYVHCFFICLVLLLMGSLCVYFPSEFLAGGDLRRLVAAGFALFWSMRLLIQLFVYDKELWVGKPLETTVHLTFSGLWTYFTAVFLWVFVTTP
jgi:hypothetical protein